MKTIEAANIIVGDRVRKTYAMDFLLELEESIRRLGLMQPIVLRETPDGMRLVAGGTRLTVMKRMLDRGEQIHSNAILCPPNHVPYLDIRELPESEYLAAELEENVSRRELPWQERVVAEKRLHELRQQLNPEHSIADTAAIIFGANPTPAETFQTKTNILVAEHLDDPEVHKAKNEREATQIVRRKMERILTQELAGRIDASTLGHKLLHGDCRELLPTIAAGTVDCVVADPPYGIMAHTFTKQSNAVDGAKHIYNDTPEYAESVISAIANAICLKPAAHVWLFMDVRWFTRWNALFTEVGWYVWPHPIIWNKCGVGTLLGDANGPRHTYETLLFAQRGGRKITTVFPDVLSIRADISKDHAAQKPVDLYRQLIELSCAPGELVIDPTCGSGTIFAAAAITKVRAIGIENDVDSHAIAKLRLAEER